jgi:hypothetical protein
MALYKSTVSYKKIFNLNLRRIVIVSTAAVTKSSIADGTGHTCHATCQSSRDRQDGIHRRIKQCT